MKVCCRIWLDNDGKAFGHGPYQILAKVRETGSLNEAAKSLDMSYNKVWKTIRMVEENLGFKLLEKTAGGASGGGSALTRAGEDMLEKYGAFQNEAKETVDKLFRKYFPEL